MTLLACAAGAALLWQPRSYLFQASFGLPASWLQAANLLDHIYPSFPQFSAVLLGLALIAVVLAGLSRGVVLAADSNADRDAAESWQGADAEGRRRGRGPLKWMALLGLAHVALWVFLFSGQYHWGLFYAWLASLGVMGWQLHKLDVTRGGSFAWAFDLKEVTFLVVLGAALTVYCAWDLDHWRYSFMGDEFGFWGYARHVVHNRLPDGRPGIVNAFTQEGVALYHPMMCTLYQSWFMRLLGINVFSWRLSSVIAAALALPGFYLFLRETISKPAALAGTVILAGNHFLITYAHHGLNNVQVLAPTLAAIGLWAWGSKRHDGLTLYAAGVMAGLGFYTFYSSRLAVGFVGLALLIVGRGLPLRRRLPLFAAFLMGFVITVMPLIVASPHFVGDMLNQSVMREATPEAAAVSPLARLWAQVLSEDTQLKWQACWSDPFASMRQGRFMFGSWVDSWVACLFLVGLVWAALHARRRPLLLWLLACYFVSVIAIGVMTQHGFPTDTRMLFLVPFYITFAMLALDVLRAALQPDAAVPSRLGAALLVLATAISLVANQYRYLVEAPAQYALAPFGLVTKLAQTNPADRHIYFVSPPHYDFNILHDLGTMYQFGHRLEILRTDAIAAGTERIERPAILVFSHLFPESTEDTQDIIKNRYRVERIETHQDGPKHNIIEAIFLPADHAG